MKRILLSLMLLGAASAAMSATLRQGDPYARAGTEIYGLAAAKPTPESEKRFQEMAEKLRIALAGRGVNVDQLIAEIRKDASSPDKAVRDRALARAKNLAMLLNVEEREKTGQEKLEKAYQEWLKTPEGAGKSFAEFLEYLAADPSKQSARMQTIFYGDLKPQPIKVADLGNGPALSSIVAEGGGKTGTPWSAKGGKSGYFTAEDLYPPTLTTKDGRKLSIRVVEAKEGDWPGAARTLKLSVVDCTSGADLFGQDFSLEVGGKDLQDLTSEKGLAVSLEDRPDLKGKHPGAYTLKLVADENGKDYKIQFGDGAGSPAAREIGTVNQYFANELRRAKDYGYVSKIGGKDYYVFGQGHGSEGQLVYYDKAKLDALGDSLKKDDFHKSPDFDREKLRADHVVVAVRKTTEIQKTAHIGEVDGRWLVLPYDEGSQRFGKPTLGTPPEKPAPKPQPDHEITEDEVAEINKTLPADWVESGLFKFVKKEGSNTVYMSFKADVGGGDISEVSLPVSFDQKDPRISGLKVLKFQDRHVAEFRMKNSLGESVVGYVDLDKLASGRLQNKGTELTKAYIGSFNEKQKVTYGPYAIRTRAVLEHIAAQYGLTGMAEAVRKHAGNKAITSANIGDGGKKVTMSFDGQPDVSLEYDAEKKAWGVVDQEQNDLKHDAAKGASDKKGTPTKQRTYVFGGAGSSYTPKDAERELAKSGEWMTEKHQKVRTQVKPVTQGARLYSYQEDGKTAYALRYIQEHTQKSSFVRDYTLEASILPSDPKSIEIRGLKLPADADKRKKIEEMLTKEAGIYTDQKGSGGAPISPKGGAILVYVGQPDAENAICLGWIAKWGDAKIPANCP